MATRSVAEIEARRRAWSDARRGLLRRAGRRVSPLMSHFESPAAILTILPANPYGETINFDEAFWSWWSEPTVDPSTGDASRWSAQVASTSMDAVTARRDGYLKWDGAFGLQRTGVFQSILGERLATGTWKEKRVFALVPLVAWAWAVVGRYGDVVARYGPDGPFQVSLALFDTSDALLSTFGEGWAEPNDVFSDELVYCREQSLDVQIELAVWPDAAGMQQLAYRIGERIENAWESHARRFINRAGPKAGQFGANRRW